jgi:hypothetical protein
VDEGTSRFYAKNAATIAARYEAATSPAEQYFAAAFPPGGRILDACDLDGQEHLHQSGI